MLYEFICPKCHKLIVEEQPMQAEHKAFCMECGVRAERKYSPLGHYWDKPKPLFHRDGSFEEKY